MEELNRHGDAVTRQRGTLVAFRTFPVNRPLVRPPFPKQQQQHCIYFCLWVELIKGNAGMTFGCDFFSKKEMNVTFLPLSHSLSLGVFLSLSHCQNFCRPNFQLGTRRVKGELCPNNFTISQWALKKTGKKTSVCGLGFTDFPPPEAFFFFPVPLVSQQRLICLDYLLPLI